MQINHLPAVKTRCCSAMPFFFFFFFWVCFLFFLGVIIFPLYFFEFHSFKQTLEIH